MKPVLECLGHRVEAEGFHPVEAKVKAIQEAPAPKNPTELKSFLGMLNFHGKFIPNLSSILEPLHSLLRKDVVWKWEVEQPKTAKKPKTSFNYQTYYYVMIPRKSWWYPVMHHPTVLAQLYPMSWKMDQRDLWHAPRVHSLRQKGTIVT